MQLFFFDTETTGFLQEGGRIIQLGAIYGFYNRETDEFFPERIINQYINTDAPMTDGAFKVHGITKEKLAPFKKMDAYIKEFLAYINKSQYVICHNVGFDVPFLQNECKLCGVDFPRKNVQTFCTMKSGSVIEYMGEGGKRPKLQDLHKKVFGKGFEAAHDAMADITATKDVFCELYKNGKIVLF